MIVTYDAEAGHALWSTHRYARSLSPTRLSQTLLVTRSRALTVIGHTVVPMIHITPAKLGISMLGAIPVSIPILRVVGPRRRSYWSSAIGFGGVRCLSMVGRLSVICDWGGSVGSCLVGNFSMIRGSWVGRRIGLCGVLGLSGLSSIGCDVSSGSIRSRWWPLHPRCWLRGGSARVGSSHIDLTQNLIINAPNLIPILLNNWIHHLPCIGFFEK